MSTKTNADCVIQNANTMFLLHEYLSNYIRNSSAPYGKLLITCLLPPPPHVYHAPDAIAKNDNLMFNKISELIIQG